MSTKRRVRVAGAILIALAWIAALGIAEWLARRFGGFVLVDGRPAAVQPHDEFGAELRVENLNGVAVWRRAHPDRPPPRPVKKGFRIIVLGDSVLLPALLDDSHGAARLLERALNARLDGGPYEVINLAEGGWNTLQEEQVLLRDGLPLDPDLVLVGVSPNDFQEFAYRDGQLLLVEFLHELDRRTTGGWLDLVTTQSYLYNYFWLALKRFQYAEYTGEAHERRAIIEPLARMAERSAERGTRLAAICLPMLDAERFDPAVDRCTFRALADWAAREGVPFLDPIPAYAAHANRELRIDNIHLTPLGHRVLAQTIFDWLVDRHLVPYRHVQAEAPDPG